MNTILAHWPQSLVVFNLTQRFVLHCLLNGKQRDGRHWALATAFDAAVAVFVLAKGGFFAVWGWTP